MRIKIHRQAEELPRTTPSSILCKQEEAQGSSGTDDLSGELQSGKCPPTLETEPTCGVGESHGKKRAPSTHSPQRSLACVACQSLLSCFAQKILDRRAFLSTPPHSRKHREGCPRCPAAKGGGGGGGNWVLHAAPFVPTGSCINSPQKGQGQNRNRTISKHLTGVDHFLKLG